MDRDPPHLEEAEDFPQRASLLESLKKGRLTEVFGFVQVLEKRKSLDPEVIEEIVKFLYKFVRKNNHRKYSSPLIVNLVPSEPVKPSTTLELLLWAFKLNIEHVYTLVFRWLICLLKYSLLPLKGISPFYELLLRRLPLLSSNAAPYLLKILIRITLIREVTPWRIHFLSIKASNPYARELLDRYWSLRPDLFEPSVLSLMGRAYIKVNWLYYHQKDCEMNSRFARVWQLAKKDFFVSLLCESATFEVPTLDVFEPAQVQLAPFTLYRSQRSKHHILNCFTMKDVFAHIRDLNAPDQAMSILDSPQLYLFLYLREDSSCLIEKLSLSLFETLVRDFIEVKGTPRDTKDQEKRNSSTLKKIIQLQSFFQESLPVVNKFLAEYLTSHWDGQSYFLELLRLISFVQITEFEELYDCILSPINYHFLKSYNFSQKLAILGIIKKLIVFWIQFEVPRINMDSSKPSVFPRANWTRVDPYKSIEQISLYYRNLVDMGFVLRAKDRDVFLHEIFMMYKMIAQVVLENEIPLKLEPPVCFCYISLCSTNPLTLSNLMEFITLLRTKLIPLCTELAKSTNIVTSAIASKQIKDLEFLNTVTKDILAVMSVGNVFLTRGQSIFRQKNSWVVDDIKYRKNLNIVTNLAFVRNANLFATKFSEERNLDFDDVIHELVQMNSEAYEEYLIYLESIYPHVVEFLRVFEVTKKKNFYNSTIQSSSTSGVSSLQPRRRLKRRFV